MKYGQICQALGNGHFDRGKAMLDALAEAMVAQRQTEDVSDWAGDEAARETALSVAVTALRVWAGERRGGTCR